MDFDGRRELTYWRWDPVVDILRRFQMYFLDIKPMFFIQISLKFIPKGLMDVKSMMA